MALKRTVTIEGNSRPTKIPRGIKSKLDRLSRQVKSNAPEIRQDRYTVTIPAGTLAPLPLLVSLSLNARDTGTAEIRLHRIQVTYNHIPGDRLWSTIYGHINNGNPVVGLYNPTNPFSPDNLFGEPDATTIKVYKRLNFSGTTKVLPSDTNQFLTVNHRFSIPKKIRFASGGIGADIFDNIFYIGGNWNAAAARTMTVNVWYHNN